MLPSRKLNYASEKLKANLVLHDLGEGYTLSIVDGPAFSHGVATITHRVNENVFWCGPVPKLRNMIEIVDHFGLRDGSNIQVH